LGRHVVPNALRLAGCRVELHETHFEFDAPDDEWLPEVGKRGWIVLTKDGEIARNYIELCALLKSGTASFVLKSGDMTGPQMAETFCRALPQIRGCVKRHRPPFVATVSKSSAVKLLMTTTALIARVSERPV
jgi:hypothetical protein